MSEMEREDLEQGAEPEPVQESTPEADPMPSTEAVESGVASAEDDSMSEEEAPGAEPALENDEEPDGGDVEVDDAPQAEGEDPVAEAADEDGADAMAEPEGAQAADAAESENISEEMSDEAIEAGTDDDKAGADDEPHAGDADTSDAEDLVTEVDVGEDEAKAGADDEPQAGDSDTSDAEDLVTEVDVAEDEAEAGADDEPQAGDADTSDAEDLVTEVDVAEVEAEDESALDVDGGEQDSQTADEPDDDRLWYVIHCYSGQENKVRHNLEQRIDSMGMKDRIFDVVVPTEEEIEVKDGKRRTVERRVFPGYILVQMILSEDSWYVVRNTPGVTGFVGMGNEPTPLRPEEVSQIIKRMEAEAPRIKVTYKIGQKVRIIDGPFNDFIGTVDDIDMERAKVRVMVSFFGRETPVELDFLQVEKA
jgi:transcriptional antiterminator NusG